jgi:uncharacterized membrane protein
MASIAKDRHSTATAAPPHVHDTATSVAELEERERAPRTFGEWLAEGVTFFSGSLRFVALNALWFTVWIVWNTGVAGVPVFDPYPFTFLTFAVSLEAIFLSTFVLISQNRQSLRADRRSMIDLQVNVIAERELTKILKIVADVHGHVGANAQHDPETQAMLNELRVEDLEQGLSEAEEEAAARSPHPSHPSGRRS